LFGLGTWVVKSTTAILNYLPIFFLLFALIAILEDSGYMPRMAFIMDRILRRFGLHGQSILPMVLGGVYVGGCAVPAVMACKGIPDERSRLATILTIPMLNCQAKVPLYILLINVYFTAHKGFAMFFISTVSLLLVLPVAKVLTMTVLKTRETAPFVMEMPAYHLPSLRVVLGKAMERTWLFLRKIVTIVAAVATVLFALLQYPGLSAERINHYETEKDRMVHNFHQTVAATGSSVGEDDPMPLVVYWNQYRWAKMSARGEIAATAVSQKFRQQNPLFYEIVQPEGNTEATRINRALRSLARGREGLLLDMRQEQLEGSILGRLGKKMEPITASAGFDWRINVALLSSLAAKENSVATLGAIFDQGDGHGSLEERLAASDTGLLPLHALALMLFMVLYPPCIATAMTVKLQTGSAKWTLFSLAYPVVLGLGSAMLIYTGGTLLGLSAVQAMVGFYALALGLTFATGFVGPVTSPSRQSGQAPRPVVLTKP
jgi:ferrous iron transport protein B